MPNILNSDSFSLQNPNILYTWTPLKGNGEPKNKIITNDRHVLDIQNIISLHFNVEQPSQRKIAFTGTLAGPWPTKTVNLEEELQLSAQHAPWRLQPMPKTDPCIFHFKRAVVASESLQSESGHSSNPLAWFLP